MDKSERTQEKSPPHVINADNPVENESGSYPTLTTDRFMIYTEVQYV